MKGENYGHGIGLGLRQRRKLRNVIHCSVTSSFLKVIFHLFSKRLLIGLELLYPVQ